jgi:hypothetical protein
MPVPITCVDNFYEDPDSIVEFANSLTFGGAYDNEGVYPGLRTPRLHLIDENFYDAFCGKVLSLFFDYGLQQIPMKWTIDTAFQKILPFTSDKDPIINSGWIHIDNNSPVAGVIYLNKDTNLNAGTSIYQVKYPELYDKNNPDNYGDNSSRIDLYDNQKIDLTEYRRKKIKHETLFDKTIDFSNVYNRLILYDSKTWHKESSFIINSQDDARLTQVFFIDPEESDYSSPIHRKNQFNI